MHRKVKNGKLGWGVGDKPNVKIKNATKIEVDGIKFRSKLEARTYTRLKEEGFNFEYEVETYNIIEKFEFQGENVRAISYTPDFIDRDRKIIIEVKGFSNDSWPLRAKLFKRYLTINRLEFKFYVVKNLKELDELINDLKNN